MKLLIVLLLWCGLFLLCWPFALLLLVALPVLWLVLLPFRLIWVSIEAVFAFIRAVLFLPARLLGGARR